MPKSGVVNYAIVCGFLTFLYQESISARGWKQKKWADFYTSVYGNLGISETAAAVIKFYKVVFPAGRTAVHGRQGKRPFRRVVRACWELPLHTGPKQEGFFFSFSL